MEPNAGPLRPRLGLLTQCYFSLSNGCPNSVRRYHLIPDEGQRDPLSFVSSLLSRLRQRSERGALWCCGSEWCYYTNQNPWLIRTKVLTSIHYHKILLACKVFQVIDASHICVTGCALWWCEPVLGVFGYKLVTGEQEPMSVCPASPGSQSLSSQCRPGTESSQKTLLCPRFWGKQ